MESSLITTKPQSTVIASQVKQFSHFTELNVSNGTVTKQKNQQV